MRETFDSGDWRTLQTAPLWIFSALVGRQRDFHPLEEQAFWLSAQATATASAGLAAEVLTSLGVDRADLIEGYAREGRPIVTGVREALSLLERRDAGLAADFARALLALAERVAMARGPFGRMISQEDAEILQLLAEILEVDAAPAAAMGACAPH